MNKEIKRVFGKRTKEKRIKGEKVKKINKEN
jgi:hypothetical protein